MRFFDALFGKKKMTLDDADKDNDAFFSENPIAKNDEDAIFRKATKLMSSKKFNESIDLYKKLIENYPENKGKYESQIGANYYFLGDYNNAIRYYEFSMKNGFDKSMTDDNIWEATEALFDQSEDEEFIENYLTIFPSGRYKKKALSLLKNVQKNLLTENEKQICMTISYDQTLAEKIKRETRKEIVLIPQINEYGEILDTKDNGLCSLASSENDNAYVFVRNNKNKFKEKDYLLFIYEDDSNRKFIASIKGSNELDIVKWRQTNGVNHRLENKDVISKLEQWKKQNDFILTEVAQDWLQLYYTDSTPNFDTFANEVYEFCTDIVDQGTGDLATLIKELKQMKGVYLWWD